MTLLTWDGTGERVYETGVSHGVLYLPDNTGDYAEGFAWNGLTTVTESPSGAEVTKKYADNINYVSLVSAEEFAGTIEAYTYPDEFAQCDGTASPVAGVAVGQQTRKTFGLSYQTLIGNDLDGTDHGFKLHLVYGGLVAPSEKAYATVNDSPDAIAFSWKFTTTPVPVPGLKPSATIVIDSTKVDADDLAALLAELYGDDNTDPHLPSPSAVLAFFTGGGVTAVTATTPAFVGGTGVITIPTITGVQYKNATTGANLANGSTLTIPTSGASQLIKAVPKDGFVFTPTSDDDWSFTRS